MSKRHELSTQEKILIEQQVANGAKSIGAAYLLWLFTGCLGGHRFYLDRPASALVILICTILGWMTIAIGIGLALLIPVGIWVLVDAFLIPSMITSQKQSLRNQLTMNELAKQRREAAA